MNRGEKQTHFSVTTDYKPIALSQIQKMLHIYMSLLQTQLLPLLPLVSGFHKDELVIQLVKPLDDHIDSDLVTYFQGQQKKYGENTET